MSYAFHTAAVRLLTVHVHTSRLFPTAAPRHCSHSMQKQQQQRQLGFARITADDAQHQRQEIALQFAIEYALRAPALAPPKRAVGRPKRQREASDVLSAAAVSTTASTAAASATAAAPLDGPVSKRGKYTSWFASPFLSDILTAYSRGHSARATVTTLRLAWPLHWMASSCRCS